MEKTKQRQRTSEQLFPLVESYESSGQLQKEFCKSHGINIGTFQYWLSKFREQNSSQSTGSFHQVKLLAEQSDINDHHSRQILIRTPSGLEIKIPMDFG